MSLSDCMMCWNTPCSCGYDYRDLSKEERVFQASIILGVDKSVILSNMDHVIPKSHPSLAEYKKG